MGVVLLIIHLEVKHLQIIRKHQILINDSHIIYLYLINY